jgi:hemerythrin superfamily protein
MDAIQLILRDHRELERLFKEFHQADRAGDPDRQAEAVRELVRQLSVHAVMEEQFVYPALRDAEADTRVLDALEEHHAVKLTLAELETLPPTHERFGAKVRLLAENVQRHLEEEERELLPVLERTLDADRRRALGEALDRAKRAAPTRPHPAAPDTPPGNFVAGAFAAVYDRSRDALRGGMDMLRTLAAQGASWTFEAARTLAVRAQRRGREAVNEAAEQGRATLDAGVRGGREALDEARALTARVELRGAQAASEVARKGRSAARSTRAGGRSARAGRGGLRRSKAGRGGARKQRR